MDLGLLEGTRKKAEEILSPIVAHLNDEFNWKATMKENAKLPSDYQHSLEALRLQEDELRADLRDYVEAWLTAEYDFVKWEKAFPKLHSRLNGGLRDLEFLILPDKTKRAKLFAFTSPRSGIPPGQREAAWLFAELIASPVHDRIGRCSNCRKFFPSIRGGEKKYCSRSCATGFTARQAMRTRRAEDQREKLQRAQVAIRKYESLIHKDEDWKGWVAKKAKVSRNWLTRAVDRGDLVVANREEGKIDDL